MMMIVYCIRCWCCCYSLLILATSRPIRHHLSLSLLFRMWPFLCVLRGGGGGDEVRWRGRGLSGLDQSFQMVPGNPFSISNIACVFIVINATTYHLSCTLLPQSVQGDLCREFVQGFAASHDTTSTFGYEIADNNFWYRSWTTLPLLRKLPWVSRQETPRIRSRLTEVQDRILIYEQCSTIKVHLLCYSRIRV